MRQWKKKKQKNNTLSPFSLHLSPPPVLKITLKEDNIQDTLYCTVDKVQCNLDYPDTCSRSLCML